VPDVPLKEYVDHRLEELDRRLKALKDDTYTEIDKRVVSLKTVLDERVKALNEAKHQNTALVALIVSLIALFIAAADVAIWAARR
jgi:hypothetical protein